MTLTPDSRAPSRYTSHSKRHASFNSPREVPLPSPTLNDVPNPFSLLSNVQYSSQPASSSKAQESPSFDCTPTPASTSRQPLTRQLSVGSITPPTHEPRPSISRVNSDHASLLTSNPSAIYPTPRPFSLPQSVSYSGRLLCCTPHSTPPPPPTPSTNTEIPHIPSRLLDRFSSASLPLPSQIPFHTLPKATSPSNDLPSTVSRSPTPEMPSRLDRFGLRFPPLEEIRSSSSSSSSGSRDSISTTDSSVNADFSTSLRASEKPSSPTKVAFPSRANDASPTASNPRPQPRPVSPFRAPQPPTQPRRAAPTAADFNTAMRRFMTPAQPPPSSYPPPEPPVILPAEPSDDITMSSSRSQAPYVPFLCHAPPPPDSWIQVETTMSEYRLHVRLPGFSREGITLATKRRRILHVVADSWDNGGGHFDRRISFGYDADLVQVRAEFDGVMLRIIIPRRDSSAHFDIPLYDGHARPSTPGQYLSGLRADLDTKTSTTTTTQK
ncbi:hypothetical protein CVT25_014497 [Psilocybe cyanescens]|uniref:SHSP domain-containing protein n=1 Tax=Psilocybe cyanescens TaxID=93625 RepID=A0A409VPA6_PSICY|nr:hypothetical protein CVT25_014497 [Psilocybe cyanescens]